LKEGTNERTNENGKKEGMNEIEGRKEGTNENGRKE